MQRDVAKTPASGPGPGDRNSDDCSRALLRAAALSGGGRPEDSDADATRKGFFRALPVWEGLWLILQ